MDLQTTIPSAMMIEAGNELLGGADRVQTAGELKELAEAAGSLHLEAIATTGEAFDRGYLLGLYTARTMAALGAT